MRRFYYIEDFDSLRKPVNPFLTNIPLGRPDVENLLGPRPLHGTLFEKPWPGQAPGPHVPRDLRGAGGGRQDVPGGQRGPARRVGTIPLVLPGLRRAAAGLRHLPPAAAVKAAPGQGLRDGPPGLEFGTWFPIPRGIVKMLSRRSHKAAITRGMFEGQHAPLRAAGGHDVSKSLGGAAGSPVLRRILSSLWSQ